MPSPTQRTAVLFIDPASRTAGWALMRGTADLIGYGTLTAPAKWNAARRVDKLADDLADLAIRLRREHGMGDTVVMETTSGKAAGRIGKASGLAFYGMAIGALRERLRQAGLEPEMVEENKWTRKIPKPQRAAAVARTFHEYVPADDPGMDAADAIGLGHWWFTAKGATDAE